MESPSSDSTDMASSSSTSTRNEAATSSTIPRFPFLRFFQTPITSLLEHYSGSLRARPDYPEAPESIQFHAAGRLRRSPELIDGTNRSGNSNGEVSIQIIGEEERFRVSNEASIGNGSELQRGESESMVEDDRNTNRETSPYQRYELQQVARWIEQFFPFSLLLLLVFVRQHLQGCTVVLYITFVLLKSNDVLRKQTALKGERKISVLVGYSILFVLHIGGVYWWFRKDDLFYALLMIPPKTIPPFWHAAFVIFVNDTMVRQAAMVFKLVILMYYKNGRGHSFRKQGQILTFVEYGLLLHRTLLPTPVWYRFFLNKEYGNLFSSLVTGLYLTVKLTSLVEKVRFFFISLWALLRKEAHYGSYATSEQVNAAGDLCAICQEKMRSPILLRCKHIFCDDCVSEWWSCCSFVPLVGRFVLSDGRFFSVFSGLNAKEVALYAGLWFDTSIFDRTAMDRRVFCYSCFSFGSVVFGEQRNAVVAEHWFLRQEASFPFPIRVAVS